MNIERNYDCESSANSLEIYKHPVLSRFNIAYLLTDSDSLKDINVYGYTTNEKPLGDVKQSNTNLVTMQVIPEYLGGVNNPYNNVYVTEECKDSFNEVYKLMVDKVRKSSKDNYKINIEVKAWFNGKDDGKPEITSAEYYYETVARDRASIPYKFVVNISSKNGVVNDKCTIYNTSNKFKFNYNTGVTE